MKYKLIKYKIQKYLIFIPNIGLFIVATIQTINLTKIKSFSEAWKILFKTLVLNYFIFACIYAYIIAPVIKKFTFSDILANIILYFLHVIMGIISLYIQNNLIRNNVSDEVYKQFK